MMILWILLAVLALFLLTLIARALAFQPRAQTIQPAQHETVDKAAATEHMQALIRCKTVSLRDKSLEDEAAFEALPKLLEAMYPSLHAHCAVERTGPRALLFRWPGTSGERPSVYMAHYDVVPVEEDRWQKPPFDAIVEDGILWGRGTLDTKGTLLGVLEAADQLIREGFVPQNDIYLSFGGDEEISGTGTPTNVALLRERGVSPAFVLDEGGAVVENVFPGVTRPAALIGLGEKGSVMLTLRVDSPGGHASAPPPHTPVGVLARAVTRVEGRPFPFRLTAPAKALFDTLGRHSTFAYRLLFANLWCFAPALDLICKKRGGEMNALVRTTCAFTQMRGSGAANVIPPTATVGANLRVIGSETMDTVRERLVSIINDDAVQVSIDGGNNPSPESTAEGEAWSRLSGAIAQTWPEAIVSPYLMVAASDARHFAQISPCVYRFSAMALSNEERKMIHGNDERIPLEKLYTTIRFYRRLMKES